MNASSSIRRVPPRRAAAAAAGVAVALGLVAQGPGAALAQQQDGGRCQDLLRMYQRELDSANSLKAQAAKQAVQKGSNALSSLGIQLDGSGDTQQAIQKGALAATSPQMQGAIIIQLLSANAHLQEMTWRGCQPQGSSSGGQGSSSGG